MTLATISTKGQLVVPLLVRKQLGLASGTRVEFLKTDAGWLFKPATSPVTTLCGILKRPKKKVSIEAMRQTVKKRAAELDRAVSPR